jgi:hypothetical protein
MDARLPWRGEKDDFSFSEWLPESASVLVFFVTEKAP